MNDRIINYMRYHPVRTQRGLEILTGLVPWSLIIFPFVGSLFLPELVAYAIIIFNVYWLYRSLTLAYFSFIGYLNIRATEKTNWVEKLKATPATKTKWAKVRHVVLICNVRESTETLTKTLLSLANQDISPKKLTVVLAMEERAREVDEEKAKRLSKKFQPIFDNLLVTWHPLLPGETIGKHSNEAFAAKKVKDYLVTKKKIPITDITITTADADSVFPKQYFSLLTFKFLTSNNPYFRFFQAPQFPFNNLDKVPFLVRIGEMVSGVSQLAGLQKYSKRYFVVSTYSMSLKLLDQIGYWDVDAIPEDWHINLKAYFETEGRVEVVPLYLVMSIDAAQSTTAWKTFKNRYQQVKRQAWGVTDVPYVVKQFFLHPQIPFWDKLIKVTYVFESHFLWSTNWFFLTIGAMLPTFLNRSFAQTALGFNLSRISSLILSLCLFGLLAIIFVNIMLDPAKKRKILTVLHPLTYLQWIALPIAGFFLSALPGMESQTRLMLGKYLEYQVTEKV